MNILIKQGNSSQALVAATKVVHSLCNLTRADALRASCLAASRFQENNSEQVTACVVTSSMFATLVAKLKSSCPAATMTLLDASLKQKSLKFKSMSSRFTQCHGSRALEQRLQLHQMIQKLTQLAHALASAVREFAISLKNLAGKKLT